MRWVVAAGVCMALWVVLAASAPSYMDGSRGMVAQYGAAAGGVLALVLLGVGALRGLRRGS